MHAGYSPCHLSLEMGAPEIETFQSSGPLCKACSVGGLCSKKHQSMRFHFVGNAELCCATYKCPEGKLQCWCVVSMHSMLVILDLWSHKRVTLEISCTNVSVNPAHELISTASHLILR